MTSEILSQIIQHKIDLDWVPIGVWLEIKGETGITTKSVLSRYKDVGGDQVKALELGVKRILEVK